MKFRKAKPARHIVPEELFQLIEEADRVIVKESPWADSKVLFESSNRTDLNALKQSLTIEIPIEFFHCMCDGEPAIYLYRGEEAVAEVTNHHGFSIRCSLWDSDAAIVDTEKWLSWFDERGIDEPRKEVEETRERQAKSQRDYKKWVSAMPEGLHLVWADSLGQFGTVNTKPLRKALRRSLPKKKDQIRALFIWFGSGAGSWSRSPSYECAAEKLLLDYKVPELIDAIDMSMLTPELVEGVARFFCGRNFSQKHPKGIKAVPSALKSILWDRLQNTSDPDKLKRIKRAFHSSK